jgi:hypothetical protein
MFGMKMSGLLTVAVADLCDIWFVKFIGKSESTSWNFSKRTNEKKKKDSTEEIEGSI